MSHRRKSARPTNKLRRTADASSVSSDSDADQGKMFADDCRPTLLVDGGEIGASTSPPQVEIPPDLWQDFEALLAATNLDAASLMRRLIQQYGRSSIPVECEMQEDECGVDTCPDDGMEDVTYPPSCSSPVDEVLDLSSSGSRVSRISPPHQSLKSFFDSSAADFDVDKPLDLTLGKRKGTSLCVSLGEKKDHVTRVLDAHNFPSDVVTLLTSPPSKLSRPGLLFPSPRTSVLPARHSSPTHTSGRLSPAHSSNRCTSSHATSHLFAHTIVSSQKYGSEESAKGSSDDTLVSRYSPGNDFSSEATHRISQIPHAASALGQVSKHNELQAAAVHSGDAHGHAVLPMALHLLSAPSSAGRHEVCQRACTSSSGARAMQLPTVTSVDFQVDASRGDGTLPNGCSGLGSLIATQSQPQVQHGTATPITLSASTVYLDAVSSGLVATATASPSVCVNIPFMTATSADGVVAIPLLQARPEVHSTPGQPQIPSTATTPITSSGQTLTFANSTPISAPSRSSKPKLGRPRGPYAKPQKVVPKDMKLVTENSLFPGVYTSILKLPWSKRSRGKSTKIKDTDTTAAATVSPATSAPVSTATPDAQTPVSPTNAPPVIIGGNPPQDSASMATAYLSMSVVVPEQLQPASSSQSVMMVYPNVAMSPLGKLGRRRGRPPKLPVLSHLLTEKNVRRNEPPHKTPPLEQENVASPIDSVHRQVSAAISSSGTTPVPDDEGIADMDEMKGDNAAPKTASCLGTESESRRLPEEASLETRFNILANQLGLEIGSAYHANLVYATPSAHQAVNSALYKEMLMSSQSLVEVKPRRRQLNDLIKPTDDVVFTSFRIRPRGSGRGAKAKRIRRRKRGEYSYDGGSEALDLPTNLVESGDYKMGRSTCSSEKGGASDSPPPPPVTSAVIAEPVPGAGNMSQRLYQDLYRCQRCDEMLPVDDSVQHACCSPASPVTRKCDRCGGPLLLQGRHRGGPDEDVGEVVLCDKCLPDDRTSPEHLLPSPTPALAQTVTKAQHQQQPSMTDAFSCQPCDMQFATIADYIEHRRSAHLEKLCRQTRKTHSLKTLACPAHTCPRLFHTQAELARHVHDEHEHEHDLVLQDGVQVSEVKDEPGKSPLVSDLAQQRATTAAPENDYGCFPPDTKEFLQRPDGAAGFACTQEGCDASYDSPLEVLEHVQAAHQGVRRWQCPWAGCVRQFGAERHLRVHLLIHKDEKPLKCDFCDYRCRQRNALNWHMRKHPEAAGHYRKFSNLTLDI
ncbi:uncharacterized protein LOC112557733 [Pomacea canaliculata]|uniref:uncharacterized protein LOC112557733 n=1 Tax=Pomacea canaliculata TaxID=400727 RepID=UPI000D72CE37|nr:uncharacterized protein LOC112557733 [Pomacea canaliculata]